MSWPRRRLLGATIRCPFYPARWAPIRFRIGRPRHTRSQWLALALLLSGCWVAADAAPVIPPTAARSPSTAAVAVPLPGTELVARLPAGSGAPGALLGHPVADALTAADQARARALALYAEYLILRDQGAAQAELEATLAAALAAAPTAEPLVAELVLLVTPLADGPTRLRAHLAPLAAAHPAAVGLNIALARSLATAGDPAAAVKLLRRARRAVGPANARLARALVGCYLQQGDVLAAHAVLADPAGPRPGTNFSFEHAAADFYDRVAYAPAYQLTLKQRAMLLRAGYLHARRAMVAPFTADDAPELLTLAQWLHRAHFDDDATTGLDRLRRSGDDAPSTAMLLATCYEAAGEDALALRVWRELADATPDDDLPWRRLSLVWWRLGRREQALAAAVTAGQIRPGATTALHLGELYLLAGQPQAALEQTTRLPARLYAAQWLRARALHQLGRDAEALATLQAAGAFASASGQAARLDAAYYVLRATLQAAMPK